mmetsp:Transcript_50278/g.79626  ORF Transcript_50278/g.79626 Transcript_50278/m.79626 type:complete len:131 (+) Transcript_50278:112-504(+)|eukprot:CAMPEP_0169096714 /NCGR_PEP_ID=MMETSP1015-20121227/19141_1 /TAXON_ID=342587 /ORGANISM="Karlodinium micrum, Strain CCMP2283" /LENGTH=130 /DNA_ID=CAMNT_0009157487 /DNA_START=98 /DNA_END=490 /DNA_ORIENTATION=-
MASRSKLLVVLAMIVVYSAWSDADVPDVVQVADAEEDGMEHADYGTQASTWMWSKWQMWKKWLMGADVADPELKGLPAGYKCGGSRRGCYNGGDCNPKTKTCTCACNICPQSMCKANSCSWSNSNGCINR